MFKYQATFASVTSAGFARRFSAVPPLTSWIRGKSADVAARTLGFMRCGASSRRPDRRKSTNVFKLGRSQSDDCWTIVGRWRTDNS